MESLETVISLVLGITSLVSGIFLWHRSSVTKNYAAERDFQHLKRNYEQNSEVLGEVAENVERLCESRNAIQHQLNQTQLSVDRTKESLIEMKAHILAISNRLEGLAAQIGGDRSSGWPKRE